MKHRDRLTTNMKSFKICILKLKNNTMTYSVCRTRLKEHTPRHL